MMVPVEQADHPIPDWPVGELIRLEGDGWPWIRTIITSDDDDPITEIAPDCCLLLDPEVTR